MTHTTAEHTATRLQFVIDNWPHLSDMLTTRHNTTWPPPMGIQQSLNTTDTDSDPDEEQRARALARIAERADSGYTLGASPAPLRLAVVDTMRTVERELVYLVDVLAQEVQRPPMSKAPAHWLPADQAKRNALAVEDAADQRRWRYGQTRSAVYAAGWLLGRVEGRPGPFLPLGPTQLRRVDTEARRAREQIERALNGVRQAQVVDRPCPLCGGVMGISSGDGGAPLVVCFGCQHEWTLKLPAVA